MKKSFLTIMFCAVLSLVSCGNEEYSFDVPAFESISAKYNINSSDIASIELTASGNYIIMKNLVNNLPKTSKKDVLKQNIFQHASGKTRAGNWENVIYGEFEQISKNEYDLKGYGVVTITTDGDEVYDLEIKLNNGRIINVGARKEKQFEQSAATDKLCRTWNIEEVGLKINLGVFNFDKMVKQDKVKDLFSNCVDWLFRIFEMIGEDEEDDYEDDYGYDDGYYEDDEEEEDDDSKRDKMFDKLTKLYEETQPISIVFTKSGSYMVEYANGTIGISTWRWEDEKKGILRYSWNTADIYDEPLGGIVNVSYDDEMLLITETSSGVIDDEEDYDDYEDYEEEDDDEIGMSISLVYGMIEAK